MFFDLTPEVLLDNKRFNLYRKLQILLYLSAILLAAYFAFRIMFPSSYFEFSFANPSAKSNTITQPIDDAGEKVKKGKFTSFQNTRFDASVTGVFSKAIVTFALDEKSNQLDSQSLAVRKSHAAFLYPEGDVLGFKDGTLLASEGNFYMISGGQLRKFEDKDLISELGYDLASFIEVSEEDLRHNQSGQPISRKEDYPDGSIFKIKEQYYILQDGQLSKFIGENAFLSRYRAAQAIEKDDDFLVGRLISPKMIGFADGSLIAYGESIYIVKGDNIIPFADPITFMAKGYSWDDVIAAAADEASAYEKDKLFTLGNVHPQGTIFVTAEDGKYYMIYDEKKHPLPSKEAAYSWNHNTPIIASEKSIAIENHCQFKKIFWSVRSYSCEMPIENMQDLVGSDYMFRLAPSSTIQADTIRIEFKKEISLRNFRFTLGEIFNRIKNNYAQ